jgi:hypothetical protein
MKRVQSGDIIELRAVNPDGDLACDTSIATPEAREGLAEALERGMRRPIRKLANGIEATFDAGARDAVMRYAEMESQCCSFLDLAVRDNGDAIVLAAGRQVEERAAA